MAVEIRTIFTNKIFDQTLDCNAIFT